MEIETPKKKFTMSVKDKIMDYLARRDHSELEIKQKLSKKGDYTPEEIAEGINWARQHNWLPEPEVVSQKVADTLHRKYKGIHFINQYLREKGLPTVGRNDELELEKARYLVKNKASLRRKTEKATVKVRIARFLSSRGFDGAVIRRIVHEEF
jgi:regulatory protein